MGKRKPTEPKLTLDEARQLLQKAGLRRTASRVAVMLELAGAGHPLSHAEVSGRLASGGFGAATIFRCLADLTEVGVLIRIDMGDHVWRFGFRGGHVGDADHPHFLCVDCGSATCLPGVDVRITPRDALAYGDITEVVLKGHCANCR
ncbi:MAG: transcriptional repressor [Planctomycetes bacterium]|nr:transcriptional repressor [Planctomycetota bacterium]